MGDGLAGGAPRSGHLSGVAVNTKANSDGRFDQKAIFTTDMEFKNTAYVFFSLNQYILSWTQTNLAIDAFFRARTG